MFYSRKKTQTWPQDTRFVVMIGGSGMLGKLLLEKKPPHIFFMNVSRRLSFSHTPSYSTLSADIASTRPKKLFSRILSQIPRIDCLVYGAYACHFTLIDKLTKEEFLKEYTVTLEAPLLLFQEYLHYCKENKDENIPKKIITIGSGVYKETSIFRKDLASYALLKAGQHQLMRALSDKFAEIKVPTIMLHPGSLQETEIATQTTKIFWDEVTQTTYREPFTIHEIF